MWQGDAALDAYLVRIRQVPLLDAEEEQRLARRWRCEGDRSAFDRLVNANLRFVVHIATRYRATGLPLMDLVQEGNTGLVRAVEKFDPDRGIRLVSYAGWWIRAHIHGFTLKAWSMVKVGTTDAQRKLFFTLRRAHRELGEVEDDPGRVERLAERCGVTPEEVLEMEQRMAGRDVSLSTPVGREEEGTSELADLLEDGGHSPEEVASDRELGRIVGDRLDALCADMSDRERFVLEHRLLSDEPLRLREIGHRFGVTRERARQIEYQTRGKLRHRLGEMSRGLDGVVPVDGTPVT